MKNLILIFLLFPSFWLNAQMRIEIHDSKQKVSTHSLSKVRKQTFKDGKIKTYFKDDNNFEITELSKSCKITFGSDSPLSIQQFKDIPIKYKVYPNPVKDIVTLSFESQSNQPAEVKITSLNGIFLSQEIIKVQIGDNSLQIPMTTFSSGIYILSIKTKEKLYTQQIVKL